MRLPYYRHKCRLLDPPPPPFDLETSYHFHRITAFRFNWSDLRSWARFPTF